MIGIEDFLTNQKMEKFFDESIFTDEVIKVINKEEEKEMILKVHRVILSSRSPVFFNTFKFKNWGEEEKEKIISLETQTPLKIFKQFIRLIYSQDFNLINEENILFFVQLSNQFECLEISEYCSLKIPDFVTIENCFQMLSIFSNINIKHESISSFVSLNLKKAFDVSADDFLNLDEDSLLDIVQNSNIGISESDLLVLILHWMKKNEIESKSLLYFIQRDLIEEENLLKHLEGIKTIPIDRFTPFFKIDFEQKKNFLITKEKNLKLINHNVTTYKMENSTVGYFPSHGYLEIPHSDVLDSLSNSLTFTLWIYPLGSQGSRLLCKATAGTSNCFTFDLHPSNSLRFILKSLYQSIEKNIPSNQWTFVAVTSSIKDGVTMFVNDEIIFEDKNQQIIETNRNPFMIGACSDRSNNFYGYMKNIQVFKLSLPKKNVIDLYHQQKQ